jgi:hypothetical protein
MAANVASCDYRSDAPHCVEYHGSAGIVQQVCGQGGGRFIAGLCDLTGTVGACRTDPKPPDITVIFDRYYPPETAAEVMAACAGTFVAP